MLHRDVMEPPLPPALGNLSGSLQALVEFLRLDPDLLDAAAEASPAQRRLAPSPAEASRWLRSLSESEKDDLLLRLAGGDLLPLQVEVRRRIREWGTPEDASRSVRGRTVGNLLAAAERKRQDREQREARDRNASGRSRPPPGRLTWTALPAGKLNSGCG